MKLLDKKKPKELDWDTLGIKEIFSQWLFFNGKLTGKETEELWNKLSLMFKATLTQQRTKLLEEIKTRIDTWGGFEDGGGNLCHYDSEILEWVNNLINKKYD